MMELAQEPVTVRTLMTGDPIIASVDMPLSEAADLMDFYRISGLPVVDWGGFLVGVISQTDLLHARATEALWHAWPGLTVRHLMTQPAVTVTSTTAVEEAAELMERLHIHRLVVVDTDGETPIGLLSISDLVHAMAVEGPP
jgi:CBS domain-containing protein